MDNLETGVSAPKDDSLALSVIAIIGGIGLFILFFLIKEHHNLSGLKEILTTGLGYLSGLVSIICGINTFRAKKKYSRNLKIVIIAMLCVFGIAGWPLKVSIDNDTASCVRDPVIVQKLLTVMNDSSAVELSHFDYLRDTNYDSINAQVMARRAGLASREMEREHIAPACKSLYLAAIDSIRGDSLASYCGKIQRLMHVSGGLTAILNAQDKASLAEWYYQNGISPKADVLVMEESGPSSPGTIDAILKYVIDRHIPITLRPVYKGDRDHDPRQARVIEFIMDKNENL